MDFGMAAETYVLLSIGDGLVAQIPALLLSIATAIIVTRVSSSNDMGELIGTQVNTSRAWIPVAAVMIILGLVPGMPNMMFLIGGAAAAAAAWLGLRRESEAAADQGSSAAAAVSGAEGASPAAPEGITPEDVSDHAPISLQIGYGLIPLAGEAEGQLVSRITGIRREASRSLGFVIPGVRIRDDLTLGPNQYRIRIGQAILAEDQVHADRKLAIPGDRSTRKLKGIEVKDPSFGLDAVWILPHQVPEAEMDDHVVVEPDSVIATHLSQIITKNAALLIGPDEVQALLDSLAKVAPTLVNGVVPKLVPLHQFTTVLRMLLAERMPISDLRRILEGIADLSARNLSPADMAEALRPALAPLLLQQSAPLSRPLPLITFEPELEQLLLRARRTGGEEGLMIDQGLAQQILGSLGRALDDASGQGKTAILIVAAALRRPLANWLRGHLPDAIVMGINELPESRRIEVVAAIGGAPGLPGAGQ
jgi:flagellar biosynthesis protein FlhA